MPPWRNTTPNPFTQMGRRANRGDSGMPPWRNTTPNPFSQMGRRANRGDSGMPPWRNTTPNPFSQMGRRANRGDSGQCPPPALQQWPPPTSQVGENSQFSSPPPRPPMFPGINESSMSWRPYNQPPAWNPGHMTQVT